MFIAKKPNNEKISVKDADPKGEYFCPTCGGKVYVKALDTEVRQAHFCHVRKCTDTWKYGEMSEWHLSWQERFPLENREVVLTDDTETHRADVFIENKESVKTVIEFQHSPMSKEEFDKRNQFYLSHANRMIWIFDVTDSFDHVCNGTIYLKNGKRCLSHLDSYSNQPIDILLQNEENLYIIQNRETFSGGKEFCILNDDFLIKPENFMADFFPNEVVSGIFVLLEVQRQKKESQRLLREKQEAEIRARNRENMFRMLLQSKYPRKFRF